MCKHAAALTFFINSERPSSCTDDQIKWSSPSQRLLNLVPKGVPVEALLGFQTNTHPPTFRHDQERLNRYAEEMAKFGLQGTSMFKSITFDKSASTVEPFMPSILVDPLVTKIFSSGSIDSDT